MVVDTLNMITCAVTCVVTCNTTHHQDTLKGVSCFYERNNNTMNYSQWIPWSISFLGLLIAFLTFVVNRKKDLKEDFQKQEARLNDITGNLMKANLKLDQLCQNSNETRLDVKSLNSKVVDIERRVTIIETNMQTAFKDIDELKERVDET